MKNSAMVLVGAAAGGFLGYQGFFWLAHQGLYGMVLPGGLLGMGAGVGRTRSLALCIACGIAGLALGIFTEWRFAPFIADDSFGYFLTHVPQLAPVKLLMMAAGAFIAFWVPFRRREEATKAD